VTAQPSEAALTPGPGPIQEAKIAETEVKSGMGAELVLKDIYFDYDQSAVRDDSKKLLNENVDWLRKNSAAKVTIEGHCDERGSSEYNLALGERRARATRDYLVAAGIDAKRIGTISFGKERPFAPGHDESAWQQNRRAHFISETR
jgi:peptidoglycan-associated lipoprotein